MKTPNGVFGERRATVKLFKEVTEVGHVENIQLIAFRKQPFKFVKSAPVNVLTVFDVLAELSNIAVFLGTDMLFIYSLLLA